MIYRRFIAMPRPMSRYCARASADDAAQDFAGKHFIRRALQNFFMRHDESEPQRFDTARPAIGMNGYDTLLPYFSTRRLISST